MSIGGVNLFQNVRIIVCLLQSKSLVGEHSVGFSPPSIMRETLIDTWEEPVENADVPAIISQSSATSAVILFIN